MQITVSIKTKMFIGNFKKKLNQIGIHDTALILLESYLSGREQVVNIEGMVF